MTPAHCSISVRALLASCSLFVACSSSNGGALTNGTGASQGSGNASGFGGGGFGAGGSSGAPFGGGGGGIPSGTGAAPFAGSGGLPASSGGVGGGPNPFPSGGFPGSGGLPPSNGGAPPASGGAPPAGDAGVTNCASSSPTGPTIFGMFPPGDPSKNGSIAATTDNNVGPGNGYTMFRPASFTGAGPLYPVVTWGNGTGTTPSIYSFLLTRLASHGFIVIASNSENVAQGTPPPMLDGVTWVFEQNCNPQSPLYQHVDTAHVGATGHSQGAFATMTAGQDPRIVATAPIEGSLPAQLHGPSLLLCGGMDTTVGCMGAQTAFMDIQGQPLMYAELLAASHTSWITDSITSQFTGGAESPFVTAVVGWMRVFLMGDTSLKPMFFGADCTLCKDTADWQIQQKSLN